MHARCATARNEARNTGSAVGQRRNYDASCCVRHAVAMEGFNMRQLSLVDTGGQLPTNAALDSAR